MDIANIKHSFCKEENNNLEFEYSYKINNLEIKFKKKLKYKILNQVSRIDIYFSEYRLSISNVDKEIVEF